MLGGAPVRVLRLVEASQLFCQKDEAGDPSAQGIRFERRPRGEVGRLTASVRAGPVDPTDSSAIPLVEASREP